MGRHVLPLTSIDAKVIRRTKGFLVTLTSILIGQLFVRKYCYTNQKLVYKSHATPHVYDNIIFPTSNRNNVTL